MGDEVKTITLDTLLRGSVALARFNKVTGFSEELTAKIKTICETLGKHIKRYEANRDGKIKEWGEKCEGNNHNHHLCAGDKNYDKFQKHLKGEYRNEIKIDFEPLDANLFRDEKCGIMECDVDNLIDLGVLK